MPLTTEILRGLPVPSSAVPGGRSWLSGLFITFILLLASLGPSWAAAQDRSRIWLGLGLGGAASSSEAGGMALMGEVVYQTGPHHFAIRAMGAADPFGEDADEFGEIGVLYGRAAKKAWGHATVAAGLAITGFGSCPTTGRGCPGRARAPGRDR